MNPRLIEYKVALLKDWEKSGLVLPFAGFTPSAYPNVIQTFLLRRKKCQLNWSDLTIEMTFVLLFRNTNKQ